MTVFVESNFVLEIALGQEQAAAAEAILQLAEHGTLNLRIPAFALSEPFSTVGRLLSVARTIALDAAVFRRAMHSQERIALSAQDAIIYAAVISELSRVTRTAPSYFIRKNRKDFDNPAIHAELATYDCRFVDSFVDGVRLLRGRTMPDRAGSA